MPQVHKKSVRGFSPILQFRPHTNIPLWQYIFWSFAEFTTHQPQFYSSLLDIISPFPWCPSTYTHTPTHVTTQWGKYFDYWLGGPAACRPPRFYNSQTSPLGYLGYLYERHTPYPVHQCWPCICCSFRWLAQFPSQCTNGWMMMRMMMPRDATWHVLPAGLAVS